MQNSNSGYFSPYVKNPFLTKKRVYRTNDLLATCKGNNLNLIIFKYLTGKFSKKHVKHRLLTADTRYPIIVCPIEDGKYFIVDGNHRYLRMKADGKTACIAFVVGPENFEQIKDSWSDYPETPCEGCAE